MYSSSSYANNQDESTMNYAYKHMAIPYSPTSSLLQQQQQQYMYATSVDSNCGSLNDTSSSLLRAANTIEFNESSENEQAYSATSQTSLTEALAATTMSTPVPNNLDFDLNYLNTNIVNIVNKASPTKSETLATLAAQSEEMDEATKKKLNKKILRQQQKKQQQLEVVEKLNNISLTLSKNLSSSVRSPNLDDHNILFDDDNEGLDFLDDNKLLDSLSNEDEHLNQYDNDTKNEVSQHDLPIERRMSENMMVLNKMSSTNKPIDVPTASVANDSMTVRKVSFQNDMNNNKLQGSSDATAATLTSSMSIGSSFTPSSHMTDTTPQNSIHKSTPSRTLMKLQLMKQQIEQDDRKKAAIHNNNNNNNNNSNNNNFISTDTTNATNATSLNTNVPLPLSSSADYYLTNGTFLSGAEIIPRSQLSQEFQSEIKLEFPTKYHVMQLAKNLQASAIESATDSAATSLIDELPQLSDLPLTSNGNQLTSPTTSKSSSSSATSMAFSNPSKKTNLNKTQKAKSYHHGRSSLKSNSGKQLSQAATSAASSSNGIYINSGLASFSNSSFNDSGSLASSDIAVLPNVSSVLSDFLPPESNLSFDSQNSYLNHSQISSPASSSFSQAEFPTEIDELGPDEIEEYLNKTSLGANLTNLDIQNEINQIEDCLSMPKTLPTDAYLNVLSPGSSSSIKASTSCPADIVRLKRLQGLHLTDDDIRLIIKDRHRKDTHNMIERRRRFNINDRIKELGTILPKVTSGEIKQNKGSILKASVDYIKNLERELNKTKELNEKFMQMAMLNRKLVNRVKELEMNSKISNNNNIRQAHHQLIYQPEQQPQQFQSSPLPQQQQQQQQQVFMPQQLHQNQLAYTNHQEQQLLLNQKYFSEVKHNPSLLRSPLYQQKINDPLLSHTAPLNVNMGLQFNNQEMNLMVD